MGMVDDESVTHLPTRISSLVGSCHQSAVLELLRSKRHLFIPLSILTFLASGSYIPRLGLRIRHFLTSARRPEFFLITLGEDIRRIGGLYLYT
jgi:hypothetical protein